MLSCLNNALTQANKHTDENKCTYAHTHTLTVMILMTLWALIGCNNLTDRQISRCVNCFPPSLILHTFTRHNHFHMCVYY